MSSTDTRRHSATRIGTMVVAGGLILLFLVFITIPLLSLFTRVSVEDFITALTSPLAMDALWLSAVVDTLTDLPIVLPPTVAGLALLMAFGRNGLLGQYLTVFDIQIAFTTIAVVIAQIFVASPFYIRQARSSFEAVDVNFEYASRTLGATPLQTFFKVTLPLAASSLLSGIIMTFARALGEFGATLMFAGNFQGKTQTMPLAIYGELQSDMAVSIALAILLVVFSFGIILVVKYIGKRESVYA